MPTTSRFPDIDIPNVSIWDFIFARKEKDYSDDKVLLIDADTSRSYTYSQLKTTAIAFGKGLRDVWDWQKGDVLALYTPNSIDTPAVTWGAQWAGGVVSPANPGYTVDELAFQLKDCGAKALITQLSHLDNAVAAAKRAGLPRNMIALVGDQRDPQNNTKHFTSVRMLSSFDRYRRVQVDPAKDLAFLVYSSGTTGKPKGVMLSHRNIIANVLQNIAGEGPLSPASSKANPDGDSILAFLPFFHIYGLTCILHQSVFRGLKCVVMAKFALETWCELVQKHKITYGFVVPPVVLQLSKNPIVDNYDLSSLRMLNSGAAPLTRELVDAVHTRTKLKVKQGYGLSEVSPTTHLQPWEDWYRTIGCVGLLLPNQTAKFMDAEENEVSVGHVGELWVKGPNVFLGYLNNAEETKNALTADGYFKTGDVGYQDDEGNFFITDRVKELIKYKGFQVPPAELEGLLATNDKIADAAVLGVQRDDLATEVPLAYVVPRQGEQPGVELEKEIVNWLAERVANHKRLRGGVRFTDAIPKSESGKILRRKLKEKFAAEEQSAKLKAKL